MIEPNRTYQHYEVLRRGDGSAWELGRGAMGITYKAFDVNLCCEVALKVVNSALLNHPSARERFVREARAAAALRHRNVASVYHLGNDGEHFFYAMEFIDGETLDALIRRRGPLPIDAVLRVILQVSKALVAADRQHLVHRDIKPTNLMIVHEDADEDMTIKVIDFGLARPSAESSSTAQLTIGGFVGTPQYASPEQLEEQPLDARSDIYSLGVTAWYLLTGHPPFTGSLASVCQQHLSKPPPWDQLPLGVPDGVRNLLDCMLEKQPAKRPQNARELRGRIESCLESIPPERRSILTDSGLQPSALDQPTSTHRTREADQLPASEFGDGRYTVVRAIGEGSGATVYQARDETDGRNVVVRTLPTELTSDTRQYAALSEEVRLIQAAPHPHLTQIFALDTAKEGNPAFLVEEFHPGSSLRDLLAKRGGKLSVEETLQLLEQAAAAADHAESRRLEHLELNLQGVCVHWPFARAASLGPFGDVTMPQTQEMGLNANLKIHPLSTKRAGGAHNTWLGDVTLISAQAAMDTRHHQRDRQYVHALAVISYELLGGPPNFRIGLRSETARTVILPALNEAANTVLAQALSLPESFAACHDFYQALADATAASPRKERLLASSLRTVPDLADSEIEPPSPEPEPYNLTEEPLPAWTGSKASQDLHFDDSNHFVEAESVADFFQPLERSLHNTPSGEAAGSAWERLSMVGGDPVRPGRWLLGAIGVTLLFVAVFAGVLALLLQGSGAKNGHLAPASRTLAAGIPPKHSANVPPPQTSVPKRIQAEETTSSPFGGTATASSPVVMVHDVPATTSSQPAASDTVTPEAAQPTPVVPEERRITVQINSLPSGAEVRLNGELLGVTPFETRLSPGDHDLIAARPNLLPTHRTIHLEPGQTNGSTEIRLMSPNLVPSNLTFEGLRADKPSRIAPSPDRGTKRPTPTRVEPAVPITDSSEMLTTPVRRPLPLEPFERGSHPATQRPSTSPVPTPLDDDND